MSGWLSLAITVILVAVAFLVLNRSIRTRTSQQAALDEIKREVGAVITELNQTTERNIEIVEDRIHRLEVLIKQADGRLRALKRDLPSSVQHDRYSREGRPVVLPPQTDEGDRSSAPDRDAGGTETPAHPASDSSRETRSAMSVPTGESVPLRQRVRQLYLQGIPLERIATITGKTIGEIELIVSLEEGSG